MESKTKYWWLMLLKGIALTLLALYIFFNPVDALVSIAFYIGLVLIITGVFILINIIANWHENENRGLRLTQGILDVVFGLVIISNPVFTASIFPAVLGFWMIFYGIMVFVEAFGLKKEGNSNWWMNIISGILAVVFGYMISTNMFVGALTITVWIGLGFLIFGIDSMAMSFRIRKLSN